jgi:hypothetical protein
VSEHCCSLHCRGQHRFTQDRALGVVRELLKSDPQDPSTMVYALYNDATFWREFSLTLLAERDALR